MQYFPSPLYYYFEKSKVLTTEIHSISRQGSLPYFKLKDKKFILENYGQYYPFLLQQKPDLQFFVASFCCFIRVFKFINTSASIPHIWTEKVGLYGAMFV